MRRLTLALGVLVTAVVVIGCNESEPYRVVGSGDVITQRPDVEPFDKIHLVGGFRVTIGAGTDPSLEITTDDNIMRFIETSVTNGTLTVALREKVKSSDGNRLTIGTASLALLNCRGAATVDATGVSGPSIQVNVQGAASVKLAGGTDKLSLHVKGTGEVDALALKAGAAKVRVEGAGKVDLHAAETLDVTLEGFGAVRYRGDPKVAKTIHGLGTVTKL